MSGQPVAEVASRGSSNIPDRARMIVSFKPVDCPHAHRRKDSTPSRSVHAGQGYRSMRDTRSIVHHKDYGEVERHTVSAAMLAATPPLAGRSRHDLPT